jgi:ADP-heptose:LPS heptosyltransferase
MTAFVSKAASAIIHYASFWHLKRAAIFIVVDCLLLSFVPRRESNTIFVLKCDLLGDYIINRNLIRSIRAYPPYQEKTIVLCANKNLKDLIQTYDGDAFDSIIWIDRDQLLNSFSTRFTTLRQIKRLGADIAINTIYYREPYIGDAIMRATCARERIGRQDSHDPLGKKDRPLGFSLGDRFYTKLIPEDHSTIFDFIRNRTFLADLLPGIRLPFNTRVEAIPVAIPEIRAPFAIIMPGASVSFREWPPARFAQIALHLYHSKGMRSLIFGTEADRAKAEAIISAAPNVFIENLCGRLSLPQMICLINLSAIGVTNDSGGIHIFAALNRPGVAVSCASAFGICHPYPSEISDKIIFVYPPPFYQLELSFAQKKETFSVSKAHYPMATVTIESVIEKIEMLLKIGHYHESLLDN